MSNYSFKFDVMRKHLLRGLVSDKSVVISDFKLRLRQLHSTEFTIAIGSMVL